MDLKLVNGDTDSIMVSKFDQSPFTEQQKTDLLVELNSHFPENIKWEDDGTYPTTIIFAAKNYALYDGKKIKTKGSALKDQKKEPALKLFLGEIIQAIINEQTNYKEIYDKYAKQSQNLTDIKPWCSKKTYTEKIDTGTRSNETKVKDALRGSDYKPGEKMYVFYLEDKSVCLAENFKGQYDKNKLLKRLHDTSKVFSTVLPTDELFINYSLKKNRGLLETR